MPSLPRLPTYANLYATAMTEYDPIIYELFCGDPQPVAWFRYDDGWRLLLDGPRSTVDRETLLSVKQHGEIEAELGGDPGELRSVLTAARARP